MNKFIKQCKATDADKLSISGNTMVLVSKKYYGVYIQIHKTGKNVTFYTSGGKEFTCKLGVNFQELPFDFKIETEYIINEGKFNILELAQADNEIKKVVKDNSFNLTGKFMIFDSIEFEQNARHRLDDLQCFHFGDRDIFQVVENIYVPYSFCKEELIRVQGEGYEGLVAKKPSHMHIEGKKSTDSFKIKPYYSVDIPITSVVKKMLWCTDKEGRIAKVSVGKDVLEFAKVGDIVEVKYEQIHKTYVQAVYIRHRFDKMEVN